MEIFAIAALIGVIISALGLKNMYGRVSALHWYHCRRVEPYDVRAFGKLAGIGLLSMGVASFLFGLSFLFFDTYDEVWSIFLGSLALIFGITVYAVLTIVAMVKYNKGIF